MTDGCVGNSTQVEEAARNHRDTTRVFTFGLGSGCDKNLVTQVARAGRGTYTIVSDGGDDLNGQVIRSLQNAMQPSLKDVEYGWNGETSKDAAEIFRNSLIYSTKLIMAKDLAAITFRFKTAEDPETRQKIELDFTQIDFKKIEGAAGEALFKMAVFNHLEAAKGTAGSEE